MNVKRIVVSTAIWLGIFFVVQFVLSAVVTVPAAALAAAFVASVTHHVRVGRRKRAAR